MIKKILYTAVILISVFKLNAQQVAVSPYSFYNFGELAFEGTNENKLIGGGLSVNDSVNLNILNPAALSKLRFTAFSLGGNSTFLRLKNSTSSERATSTNFDYLAIGIPTKYFGFSFGLKPYSRVGYKLENFYQVDQKQHVKQFYGKGGINQTFLSFGFKINKNLSFGLQGFYNFGTINHSSLLNKEGILLTTREENESKVQGFNFSLGLSYFKKIRSNRQLNLGLTYTPKTALKSETIRELATISFDGNGNELIHDRISSTLANQELIVPNKVGIGVSFQEINKWLVSLDYNYLENNSLNNLYETGTLVEYNNGMNMSLGGYYIPNHDSYSKFFHRVMYQASISYKASGMKINTASINQVGINFGVGVPLGLTRLHLGIELGQRGTKSNNLLMEQYQTILVGFSFGDKWFNKRKIN